MIGAIMSIGVSVSAWFPGRMGKDWFDIFPVNGSTLLISSSLPDLIRHHLLESERGFDFVWELEQLTMMSEVKSERRELWRGELDRVPNLALRAFFM